MERLCPVPIWKCNDCLNYKRLDEFNKSYTIPNRPVQYKCKKCEKKYRQKYVENIKIKNKNYLINNRGKILTYQQKWRYKNWDSYQEKRKKYRADNKKQISAQRHDYYLKNKEKISQSHKQWTRENKEKIRKQKQEYQFKHRKKYAENARRWRKNNPERERQNRQKYTKFRRQNDPQYALRVRLSDRLKSFLKHEKGGRTSESLIGYSMLEFKNHLEKAFIEGMSWEKFLAGKIDIHHIVPNAAFKYTTAEEKSFKLCWSLKNLCPEWREINRKLNDYLPDGTRAMNLTNKITTQEEFDYWYPRCLALRLAVRNE